MRSLIGGPTDLTVLRHFTRTVHQMHPAPIWVHQNPLKPLRGRMFPVDMQFRDNLFGIRETSAHCTPQGCSFACRKSLRGPKAAHPIARKGEMQTAAGEVWTSLRKDPFQTGCREFGAAPRSRASLPKGGDARGDIDPLPIEASTHHNRNPMPLYAIKLECPYP